MVSWSWVLLHPGPAPFVKETGIWPSFFSFLLSFAIQSSLVNCRGWMHVQYKWSLVLNKVLAARYLDKVATARTLIR